ncbi:hypothetical protein KIN20_014124 [Parelaphostrongylus tenuis]|uniref:Uncharacterized protein n=1 Tax=Parelaphostrongylus tenuis TaxID=148309 RepID=A0AAD5N2V1_PARTN|nr:hypothetical protein KIN20_014124 [Parelaphostrongylus tenuis]
MRQIKNIGKMKRYEVSCDTQTIVSLSRFHHKLIGVGKLLTRRIEKGLLYGSLENRQQESPAPGQILISGPKSAAHAFEEVRKEENRRSTDTNLCCSCSEGAMNTKIEKQTGTNKAETQDKTLCSDFQKYQLTELPRFLSSLVIVFFEISRYDDARLVIIAPTGAEII